MKFVIIALCSLSAVFVAAYPGEDFRHPTIHFSHSAVANNGGAAWHDIAGAFTHNGIHHVFMGQGWNHGTSTDLVHWQEAPHGPNAIVEDYHGMSSNTDPCSGYVVRDDDGIVCAGFRQCGSESGINELPNDWDVPMEIRCAQDQENLTDWSEDPSSENFDYIFPLSFWRAVPYDPARPWYDDRSNMWYHLISLDGCNSTDTPRNTPDGRTCPSGGALYMWESPALRGENANWQPVGNVFADNTTVLKDYGFLSREFVTIDLLGTIEGDPDPDQQTLVFLNNVGGNGGGDGCCSGTTAYTILSQPDGPGTSFEYHEEGRQSMVDWGSFVFRDSRQNMLKWTNATDATDYLDGTARPGFRMARTLGSEESNQVTRPGRRVLLGWTGESPFDPNGAGSVLSLPRELSLADDYQLKQKFVDELAVLRKEERTGTQQYGLAAHEVIAVCPSTDCSLELFADASVSLVVSFDEDLGLVTLDGTTLGVDKVRAAPTPKSNDDYGYKIHAIVDHSIVEFIVNDLVAFTIYVNPDETNVGEVRVTGGSVTSYELADANVAGRR